MIRAGSVGRKDTCDRIEIDEEGVEWDVAGDNDWDEKGRTMISHIYVSFSNGIITSIQFGYLENGGLVLSEKYGPEGQSFRVVRLNQDEYVTGLSGALGQYGGIKFLTFHTNRGKHGPIGHDDVDASRPLIEIDPAILDRREFGGFFGSYSSGCVTSIGVYVCPISSSHKAV